MGVRLGSDLNANTGYDETIYILPVPVGNRQVLDTGLAILREWAGNALLTDADIDTERAVVLAELRSGAGRRQRVQRQIDAADVQRQPLRRTAADRHGTEPGRR